MNKKLALLATPALMLAATTAVAETAWGVTPFFGADAQWRHMEPKKEFGDKEFKHDYPQGDVYAGIKFGDYLGIQVGYEASIRQSKTINRVPPYTSLGITSEPANPLPGIIFNGFEYTSTSQIKGPHVDLVGFVPICKDMEFVVSVGLANSKVSLKRQPTALTVNNVTRQVSQINTPVNDAVFSKRKNILRLMGGFQQYVTECVGVRASVTWEQTKKFGNLLAQNFSSNPPTAQIRNSVSYGLGFFVTF
jgi:opacity protein-like surface antigen